MHAFVMFANECLGELEYEAVAPAIAMAALMVIFAIDYSAARWLARRSALHAHKEPASPLSSGDEKHGPFGGHDHDFSGVPDGVFAGSSSSRAKWDVKLLEAGICFHSIMIGVTLGSMTGSGFIPTFCAIIFHQLFEGLGLGARIGRLQYPNGGSWQKWVMCVVYTLITPLGIAIVSPCSCLLRSRLANPSRIAGHCRTDELQPERDLYHPLYRYPRLDLGRHPPLRRYCAAPRWGLARRRDADSQCRARRRGRCLALPGSLCHVGHWQVGIVI
jgi:hypothetical protein